MLLFCFCKDHTFGRIHVASCVRALTRDGTGDILDRHTPPDQLKLLSKKARDVDLQENVYELERVCDHRGSPGHYEYLVKWKNYRQKTWEPASSFHDDTLIRDYW